VRPFPLRALVARALCILSALSTQHVVKEVILHASKPKMGSHPDQRQHHELVLVRGRVLSIIAIGAAKQRITNSLRPLDILKVRLGGVKVHPALHEEAPRGP